MNCDFRKHLSAPGMLKCAKEYFDSLIPKYKCNGKIQISDILMSGIAIFMLKVPSLLQFDKSRNEKTFANNLKHLFQVNNHPSDTHMRKRLDEVDPADIRKIFKKLFSFLQRGKVLNDYKFINNKYLLSIDGTGHYSSKKVHCNSCCKKHHRNGDITYYHQMLGAVIVHPDEKCVIPLCPEPILNSDGNKKNDCERNASKRLLHNIRREHPHLDLIVVEDALASNAPHIKVLQDLDMSFILGVKPGDHKYLFDWVNHSDDIGLHSYSDEKGDHEFKYINNVPLNDSNDDLKVNFLEYKHISKKGKTLKFSWVTDITLTKDNIKSVMKGGRSRWKIENETFNTLKNQGYNFEHNYGHGNKNLCTILSMLMMLAFFIDQMQEKICALFNKALVKSGARIVLWQKIRSVFNLIQVESWKDFYRLIFDPPDIKFKNNDL